MGTRSIDEASRYAVGIQLSSTALRLNSVPIAGRATFSEDPMKGVRKEARLATQSALDVLTGVPTA